jgi:hypothetical protein
MMGIVPSVSAKNKCPFTGHFSLMERGKFIFQSDGNEK